MKKIFKPLLVLLIVALLVLLIVGFVLNRSTRLHVAELRQKIKQSGDPLYFVDFQEEPIEEEDNCYFHLMNAKEDILAFQEFYYEAFSDGVPADFRVQNTLTQADIDVLLKGIEDHRELFAEIERMADSRQHQADLDFEAGFGILLPHYPLYRTVGNALEAKTIADAAQQKGDEAIRNCIQGLKISRLLMKEPILVSFLAALAIERTMLDSAFYVVSRTSISEEARADLEREISNSNRKLSLVNALKGERSCGIQTFKNLREGGDNALEGMGSPNLIPGFGFKNAYLNDDEAEYITSMNVGIDHVEKSHAERVRFGNEFSKRMEESNLRFRVTKMIFSATIAASEAVDFNDAKARCLHVVLRLQAEGEVALDELPEDPYRSQPLRTDQTEQGWMVYSIGKNQKDDKGDFGTPTEHQHKAPDVGYGPVLLIASDEGTQ